MLLSFIVILINIIASIFGIIVILKLFTFDPYIELYHALCDIRNAKIGYMMLCSAMVLLETYILVFCLSRFVTMYKYMACVANGHVVYVDNQVVGKKYFSTIIGVVKEFNIDGPIEQLLGTQDVILTLDESVQEQ